MRKPIVLGNWKMNASFAQAKDLCEGLKNNYKSDKVDVAVCVPFPYLSYVDGIIAGTPIQLGAQNVSQYNSGAYTGDVSADMLADCNCKFVLVGHSERRTLFGETSLDVAIKAKKSIAAGITTVLCIGETLQQREDSQLEEVLTEQLLTVLNHLNEKEALKLIIAYEPVWAIGTGLVATTSQVQDVHAFLRKTMSDFNQRLANELKIVYGGSVKASNAADIFALKDVDGGLIGGASLKYDEFIKIIERA